MYEFLWKVILDFAFENYDNKVVFRTSGLMIDDVVFACDFTCKQEAVDISYPFDAFFAEQNSWFGVFLPFVAHFSTFVHKYNSFSI